MINGHFFTAKPYCDIAGFKIPKLVKKVISETSKFTPATD